MHRSFGPQRAMVGCGVLGHGARHGVRMGGDAVESFIGISDIELCVDVAWIHTAIYIWSDSSIRIGRGHGPSAIVPVPGMSRRSTTWKVVKRSQVRARITQLVAELAHSLNIYLFRRIYLTSLTPIPGVSQHSICPPWQGTYCVSSNLFAVCVA